MKRMLIKLIVLNIKICYHLIVVYSLTDEESRKNWEEYGNPDGPRGVSTPLL